MAVRERLNADVLAECDRLTELAEASEQRPAIRARTDRRVKVTRSWLERTSFTDSGQVVYTDTEMPGFVVVIGKTAKTFCAQKLVEGKFVRITIGRFPQVTVEVARREAQQLLCQMALGRNPRVERQRARTERERRETLAAMTLWAVWTEYKAIRRLKRSSIQDAEQVLNAENGLGPWKDRSISAITQDDVLARFRFIGTARGKTYYANGCFRLLGALMNYAIARGWIIANPVKILSVTDAWHPESRRTGVVRDVELPRLFAALRAVPSKHSDLPSAQMICDLVELLLFTGLRRSEALGLRWSQINERDRSLLVEETKNGDQHRLPLTDPILDILARRRAEHPDSPWVFPGRVRTGKGHLTDPQCVLDLINEEAGLELILHDLRRTFVSAAERVVSSFVILKKLVNHRMSDVTSGYVIRSFEDLREPMQRISDHFIAHSKEVSHELTLTACA